MSKEVKVNLDVLDVLQGVEENVENYLNKIKQSLNEEEIRKYLISNIEGHTAGLGDEALKYAKQQGTFSQYSNYELARLDLGLQFNSYYFNPEDIVTKEMVEEYVDDTIEDFITDIWKIKV